MTESRISIQQLRADIANDLGDCSTARCLDKLPALLDAVEAARNLWDAETTCQYGDSCDVEWNALEAALVRFDFEGAKHGR